MDGYKRYLKRKWKIQNLISYIGIMIVLTVYGTPIAGIIFAAVIYYIVIFKNNEFSKTDPRYDYFFGHEEKQLKEKKSNDEDEYPHEFGKWIKDI